MICYGRKVTYLVPILNMKIKVTIKSLVTSQLSSKVPFVNEVQIHYIIFINEYVSHAQLHAHHTLKFEHILTKFMILYNDFCLRRGGWIELTIL